MKTKNKHLAVILTFCAIITLSFSFVSNKVEKKANSQSIETLDHRDVPVGGFALGNQLEK